MARRYSRDNRGRFAGGGSSSGGGGKVGATARGGRLKTAAGNKRKTQTAIIKSTESKQAGKDLLKASQKSFKVNAPTKFGGENQGYATPRGKAAEQGQEGDCPATIVRGNLDHGGKGSIVQGKPHSNTDGCPRHEISRRGANTRKPDQGYGEDDAAKRHDGAGAVAVDCGADGC